MLKKIFAMFARMDQAPESSKAEVENKEEKELAQERAKQQQAAAQERMRKQMEEETIEVPVQEDKAA